MEIDIIEYTSIEACLSAAGVCRDSKNPEKALQHALSAGHDSLLEHWVASFKIQGISRACSHQLVRHRMASYAQQSQRHIKIDNNHDWYVTPMSASPRYHTLMEVIRRAYYDLLDDGVPLEDARFVLPNATKTSLVWTANARSLINFFNLRCCSKAQWEIRDVAEKVSALCWEVQPQLFSKSYPERCAWCKERCVKGDVWRS